MVWFRTDTRLLTLLNQLFKWFIQNYEIIQDYEINKRLALKIVNSSIVQSICSKPPIPSETTLQECHWINYSNDSFKTTESSRNESSDLRYTVGVSLNQLFKWFI